MSDSTVTTLDDNTDAAKAAAEAAKPTGGKTKAQQKAEAKAAGISDNVKTITIHNGEGSAGREDVFLAVNGYSYNIKRGKPVEVPVEVVHVLQNAVTTVYENGEAIELPRFAFSVHN